MCYFYLAPTVHRDFFPSSQKVDGICGICCFEMEFLKRNPFGTNCYYAWFAHAIRVFLHLFIPPFFFKSKMAEMR